MFDAADTLRTEEDHMANDNPFGIDDSQEAAQQNNGTE